MIVGQASTSAAGLGPGGTWGSRAGLGACLAFDCLWI